MSARTRKLVVIFSLVVLFSFFGVVAFFITPGQLHCRKNFIFPMTTGSGEGLYETSIQYLTTLKTRTCIVDVNGKPDALFPDHAARIKIGYFDQLGIMHIYPARMGGIDSSGKLKGVSTCIKGSCESRQPIEARRLLKKDNIIYAEIVARDSAPWQVAEVNKKYQVFFDQLKKAITSGENFPVAPNDEQFAIQLWQIDL